jgi:hypothetical protein
MAGGAGPPCNNVSSGNVDRVPPNLDDVWTCRLGTAAASSATNDCGSIGGHGASNVTERGCADDVDPALAEQLAHLRGLLGACLGVKED